MEIVSSLLSRNKRFVKAVIKLRRGSYQGFLSLSNFAWFLYFVPNFSKYFVQDCGIWKNCLLQDYGIWKNCLLQDCGIWKNCLLQDCGIWKNCLLQKMQRLVKYEELITSHLFARLF